MMTASDRDYPYVIDKDYLDIFSTRNKELEKNNPGQRLRSSSLSL